MRVRSPYLLDALQMFWAVAAGAQAHAGCQRSGCGLSARAAPTRCGAGRGGRGGPRGGYGGYGGGYDQVQAPAQHGMQHSLPGALWLAGWRGSRAPPLQGGAAAAAGAAAGDSPVPPHHVQHGRQCARSCAPPSAAVMPGAAVLRQAAPLQGYGGGYGPPGGAYAPQQGYGQPYQPYGAPGMQMVPMMMPNGSVRALTLPGRSVPPARR